MSRVCRPPRAPTQIPQCSGSAEVARCTAAGGGAVQGTGARATRCRLTPSRPPAWRRSPAASPPPPRTPWCLPPPPSPLPLPAPLSCLLAQVTPPLRLMTQRNHTPSVQVGGVVGRGDQVFYSCVKRGEGGRRLPGRRLRAVPRQPSAPPASRAPCTAGASSRSAATTPCGRPPRPACRILPSGQHDKAIRLWGRRGASLSFGLRRSMHRCCSCPFP